MALFRVRPTVPTLPLRTRSPRAEHAEHGARMNTFFVRSPLLVAVFTVKAPEGPRDSDHILLTTLVASALPIS
jgi:hypothetical protein